jgi:hypothetical protein
MWGLKRTLSEALLRPVVDFLNSSIMLPQSAGIISPELTKPMEDRNELSTKPEDLANMLHIIFLTLVLATLTTIAYTFDNRISSPGR